MITMRLYDDLSSWYRLVDPPHDHAEDCARYAGLIEQAVPGASTLLELGAGAGHNVVHLKSRFRCTATDLSPRMLALSRELNPQCEHLLGDMRSLRLDRTYDAVLLHDAVVYMTSREDLQAAMRTAFVHTRPGGVAIFEPDCVRETFREGAVLEGHDEGDRQSRFMHWSWDPDPADDTCLVDFSFLFRKGDEMWAEHDRHVEGLFPRAFWMDSLRAVGYEVEDLLPPDDGLEHAPELFFCRRPSR
jgi:SAM-dependent methyltransferase